MSIALRRGIIYLVLFLATGALLMQADSLSARAQAGSQPASAREIEVSAHPINSFKIGSAQTRFGPLEFVGGLEMTSSSRDFGGLSSFRFLKPGAEFIAVSDTGFWCFGIVTRDADGKPSGFGNVRMEQMFDRAGKLSGRKRDVDAEGLAIRDGTATVSFERDHRISQFRIDPGDMKPAFGELDFLVPKRELRQNAGFETVAHSPAGGALGGALVVVSEKSLDRAGNIFAAILGGPQKGAFTVKRHGDFGITDGAFLPDGDLLLLERSFSVMAGVKMRLRRIAGDTIRKGSLVDGPVLFEAGMLYQIDNMEGLDVWTRDDGAQMVSLLSDDNLSLLQRNIYLEFVLHGDGEPHAAREP